MTKTVLVVEDDPTNRKLLRDLLQVSGYAVIEASNGLEAVRLARAERPGLILMDIRMPVMDGLEATRLLRADGETRDIPIVAVTSSAMDGDEEATKEAGCDAHMTKPIETHEFLQTVARYLGEAGNGEEGKDSGSR